MWNWVAKLQELHAAGKPYAIVTVTRCSGSTPRETGAKMLVLEDRFHGTIGGGALELQALQDARECLKQGVSKTLHYPLFAAVSQCCGGVIELLVETMNTAPLLYLFGAGHVGQALARTLQGTDFEVTLIDSRPEWPLLEEHGPLPPAIRQVHGDWRDFVSGAPWDAQRVHVLIMTHEHGLDLEVLKAVLDKPSRFLGMIGSTTKWKSFQDKLQAAKASPEAIARVRCPVGLDIGGKAPQEIAISIAAELLKVRHRR